MGCSVEVGVRVEAYNCEEWTQGAPRHINSAFLLYERTSPEGHVMTFPEVIFTTQVSQTVLSRRALSSQQPYQSLNTKYGIHVGSETYFRRS